MNFWEDFSSTVSRAAESTAKGADKLTNIAKLKYRLSNETGKLDGLYRDMGKLKCSELEGKNTESSDYDAIFAKIYETKLEIAGINDKLSELLNTKTCQNCKMKAPKDAVYCPRCGEKLKCEENSKNESQHNS